MLLLLLLLLLLFIYLFFYRYLKDELLKIRQNHTKLYEKSKPTYSLTCYDLSMILIQE